MALEWLKAILGAAYTPEIDAAVAREISRSFAPRGELDAQSARVAELERRGRADRANYERELDAVRLTAAVEGELTAAGARNNVAVRAVLGEFLKDAEIVDGKVVSRMGDASVALGAKLEAMKKDAATDFLFGAPPKYTGWKPGENGGKKSGGGKRPSEMSYSELAAYLAENPDARLEE